jgi:glycosyltransferase involved in cell wall biosynthesis
MGTTRREPLERPKRNISRWEKREAQLVQMQAAEKQASRMVTLGIRFTPHAEAGSQMTIARDLIPAIFEAYPNCMLFTGRPELFSCLPSGKVVKLDNKRPWAPVFNNILWGDDFRGVLENYHCNVVYYPYTYEYAHIPQPVKQIVTVHDLIPVRMPDDFRVSAFIWKFFMLRELTKATAIACVSESTKRDLLKYSDVGQERASVIANGIDCAWLLNGQQRRVEEPYVLYVCSTIYPYKNVERLISAFYRHCKDLPLRLVIVGSVPRRYSSVVKTLRQEAKARNNSVLFFEKVDQSTLASLYQYAEAFCYPSLCEGFGLPPLEAMAAGIPVIASSREPIPDVCGHAALYFDPLSEMDIGRALRRVVLDQDLRRDLTEKGSIRVRKFSWQQTARSVIDLCLREV